MVRVAPFLIHPPVLSNQPAVTSIFRAPGTRSATCPFGAAGGVVGSVVVRDTIEWFLRGIR